MSDEFRKELLGFARLTQREMDDAAMASMNYRFKIRRDQLEELGHLDDFTKDNWVGVALTYPEAAQLRELLRIACPTHAPILVSLLEELDEGFKQVTIVQPIKGGEG